MLGAQRASCAGRADYFGALPNLAARVSALAAPGQVLVEGSAGFAGPAWAHAECGLVLLPPGGAPGGAQPSRSIELEPLGYYLLKARPSARPGTSLAFVPVDMCIVTASPNLFLSDGPLCSLPADSTCWETGLTMQIPPACM